jgi:hypothetical protein
LPRTELLQNCSGALLQEFLFFRVWRRIPVIRIVIVVIVADVFNAVSRHEERRGMEVGRGGRETPEDEIGQLKERKERKDAKCRQNV